MAVSIYAIDEGTLLANAAGTIPAFYAVAMTALGLVAADPSTAAHEVALLGINTRPVTAGNQCLVATGTIVINPGWSWTPGASLYVGAGGALSSSAPGAGWSRVIGVALTATMVLVALSGGGGGGGGGGEPSDGNKGDITVSGSGLVWELNAPVDPARLGSGSPSSSTFLRGDGTWATPSGGGGSGSLDGGNATSVYGGGTPIDGGSA